jgi:hypothetical protein
MNTRLTPIAVAAQAVICRLPMEEWEQLGLHIGILNPPLGSPEVMASLLAKGLLVERTTPLNPGPYEVPRDVFDAWHSIFGNHEEDPRLMAMDGLR